MSAGKKEKQYVFQRDGGRCRYCRKKLRYPQATLDHYVPVSRGGPDDCFNLVLCCRYCNKVKGSGIPAHYEAVLIRQFIQGVRDGFIKAGVQKKKKNEVTTEAQAVNRLEKLGDTSVFQHQAGRVLVRKNVILQMTKLNSGDLEKETQHL